MHANSDIFPIAEILSRVSKSSSSRGKNFRFYFLRGNFKNGWPTNNKQTHFWYLQIHKNSHWIGWWIGFSLPNVFNNKPFFLFIYHRLNFSCTYICSQLQNCNCKICLLWCRDSHTPIRCMCPVFKSISNLCWTTLCPTRHAHFFFLIFMLGERNYEFPDVCHLN